MSRVTALKKETTCTQCDEKATVNVGGKPYCGSCGIVAAIHINGVQFPFLARKSAART
jgi:hypothetical protein